MSKNIVARQIALCDEFRSNKSREIHGPRNHQYTNTTNFTNKYQKTGLFTILLIN